MKVIVLSRPYISPVVTQRNSIKKMSDYLTTLPVELIYTIIDNVPLVDILTSVCLVNKRLRSISLIYPRFQLDFSCVNTSMDKSQFDSICTQMVYSTSQVVSLKLFDENDPMAFVKNDLFFSRFNIIDTTFPNLRSLILTYIKYSTWRLFKSRLPPLIMTLSIYLHLSASETYSDVTDASDIFNERIFLSPLLKHLSVKNEQCFQENFPNSSSKFINIIICSILIVNNRFIESSCRRTYASYS